MNSNKSFQTNSIMNASNKNEIERNNNFMNRAKIETAITENLIKNFDEIISEYKKFKALAKQVQPNSQQITNEAKNVLISILEKIQHIFLSFHKNHPTKCENNKSIFEDDAFLIKNNEMFVEIIVYIGFILTENNSNESDQFKLYLKYSNLITNLAEKTPIRLNNSLVALNKLNDYLIETAFVLLKDFSSNKKQIHEIFRSIGALLYQNGSNLNIYNLNRLFGIAESYSKTEFDEKNDGLLFSVRKLIELESETAIKTDKDLDPEMIGNLNLITTQLIFNLTMPNQNESNIYIDDKYKVKSVFLLMKILRSNNISYNVSSNISNSFINDTTRHFLNDSKTNDSEQQIMMCKILTKALQALENLFASIQNVTEYQTNWLQSNFINFQLGEILAIAKNLSFYGVLKDLSLKQTQANEEKLHPSNVSILLEKKRVDDESNKISDEEEKPNSLNNSTKKFKNNQINTKRYSKTNTKQSSSNMPHQPLKQSDFNLNSIQCLRETQVPLIQYKSNINENSNQLSDSDASADSISSSKFYIEKCNAKVRIAAIGVLLTAFQSLDKKTVLSYWESFLGQSRNFNLIWSVRNDPSPKVRLIAATTLSVYLECARSFFSLAASENTNLNIGFNTNASSSSFVPISHTIANLIRQLHVDLNYSINNFETFSLNQIQLLKCLQCLIKATPYQKLKPGLVYKLITNLHVQLSLKSKLKTESSINLIIEILNCVLLILTNHHQLAEVHLALISNSNKKEPINQMSKQSEDMDSLSQKLEQISSVFKVPVITQSRVTYFYTNDNNNINNSQSYKSSLNDSLSVSGQMTPFLNDLIGQENENDPNKSWLVSYCLKYYSTTTSTAHKLVCLDLLQIICKKYFDLLRRDLFFDELVQLILNNIELASSFTNNDSEQILIKTLKLLEELARCLATVELRTMNCIDLNDCCKFWSSLLISKLISHMLCNEHHYLLSSSCCDCLASIGASIFELLPFQKRIYCLTNLLHLTKSNSSLIRSSSVRALGVYVTFTSLKEDQNFLNDLSQCLLTLLSNDTNNLVRQKAAWSLSNLSEVLVENADKLGKAFTDEFNLTIWLRLLDVSSNTCARESDKLKSYLVRTIGNLIRYITVFDSETIAKELKDLNRVEKVITKSIESLCNCRSVKMLKVKWNLSHAIGVALNSFSSWELQFNNTKWLLMFYDTLLDLFTQSTNFKVRINACIALMTINLSNKSSNIYSKLDESNKMSESIFVRLWIGLIDAFSKINNENIDLIDASNELQHKNTLLHQLCKLFTYLCKNLRIVDLNNIMIKCLKKVKTNETNGLTTIQLRSFLIEYIKDIFDQIEQNKLEVQYYNEALTHLNLLNSNKQNSLDEDCINLLNSLLQKPSLEITKTESESSENEHTDSENKSSELDYRKKFPFSQVYD